jgi:hypothetical protein
MRPATPIALTLCILLSQSAHAQSTDRLAAAPRPTQSGQIPAAQIPKQPAQPPTVEPAAPGLSAPNNTTPTNVGDAATPTPALTADTGGALARAETAFGIIGDRSPISINRLGAARASIKASQFPPLPNPLPPNTPPGDQPARSGVGIFAPNLRALKIAENMSPFPQNRFFGSFNIYENVGETFNRRDGAPYTNLRVFSQFYGVEKTFFDGNASVGLRMPIQSLVVDSNIPGTGGTSTAAGDLNVFVKTLLAQTEWSDGRIAALSAGISVAMPTGPRSFAGFPGYTGFRSTYLQPFIGTYYRDGAAYFQGFTAIDVPTGSGSSDVTTLFNDYAVGYFLYESHDPSQWLTAIAPTFEVHINTPLNHRGYSPTDPAASIDQVNLTYGVNFGLFTRALLTTGFVTPVTGPRPFDWEYVLQFNYYFGGRRANQPLQTAPPLF